MNNKYNSVKVKLLMLIIGIFLAVTLPGCIDPIVSDMQAEHDRLQTIVMQDLQQSPFNDQMDPVSQKFREMEIQTRSGAKTLFPAP